MNGNVDPCLYVKKSEKGIFYVALYTDNNLMIEDVEIINDAIAALTQNRLVIKMKEPQDYLFCDVKFLTYKKLAWLE